MRLREDAQNSGSVLLQAAPRVGSPGSFGAAYLVSDDATALVAKALHSVGLSVEPHQAGPSQIPRYSVSGTGRDAKAATEDLSARERQVLTLIAIGENSQSIAEELGVSVDTVKTHVRNVLAKMGARNRSHAVHIAHEWDLLR